MTPAPLVLPVHAPDEPVAAIAGFFRDTTIQHFAIGYTDRLVFCQIWDHPTQKLPPIEWPLPGRLSRLDLLKASSPEQLDTVLVVLSHEDRDTLHEMGFSDDGKLHEWNWRLDLMLREFNILQSIAYDPISKYLAVLVTEDRDYSTRAWVYILDGSRGWALREPWAVEVYDIYSEWGFSMGWIRSRYLLVQDTDDGGYFIEIDQRPRKLFPKYGRTPASSSKLALKLSENIFFASDDKGKQLELVRLHGDRPPGLGVSQTIENTNLDLDSPIKWLHAIQRAGNDWWLIFLVADTIGIYHLSEFAEPSVSRVKIQEGIRLLTIVLNATTESIGVLLTDNRKVWSAPLTKSDDSTMLRLDPIESDITPQDVIYCHRLGLKPQFISVDVDPTAGHVVVHLWDENHHGRRLHQRLEPAFFNLEPGLRGAHDIWDIDSRFLVLSSNGSTRTMAPDEHLAANWELHESTLVAAHNVQVTPTAIRDFNGKLRVRKHAGEAIIAATDGQRVAVVLRHSPKDVWLTSLNDDIRPSHYGFPDPVVALCFDGHRLIVARNLNVHCGPCEYILPTPVKSVVAQDKVIFVGTVDGRVFIFEPQRGISSHMVNIGMGPVTLSRGPEAILAACQDRSMFLFAHDGCFIGSVEAGGLSQVTSYATLGNNGYACHPTEGLVAFGTSRYSLKVCESGSAPRRQAAFDKAAGTYFVVPDIPGPLQLERRALLSDHILETIQYPHMEGQLAQSVLGSSLSQDQRFGFDFIVVLCNNVENESFRVLLFGTCPLRLLDTYEHFGNAQKLVALRPKYGPSGPPLYMVLSRIPVLLRVTDAKLREVFQWPGDHNTQMVMTPDGRLEVRWVAQSQILRSFEWSLRLSAGILDVCEGEGLAPQGFLWPLLYALTEGYGVYAIIPIDESTHDNLALIQSELVAERAVVAPGQASLYNNRHGELSGSLLYALFFGGRSAEYRQKLFEKVGISVDTGIKLQRDLLLALSGGLTWGGPPTREIFSGAAIKTRISDLIYTAC